MIKFFIFGHPNILSTHRNTLEFTKDSHLTKNGDCIVGVRATYDIYSLMKSFNEGDELTVIIKGGGITETIHCIYNPKFSDKNEMVIRRSDFDSQRTLGIRADRVAIDLDRELIKYLQSPDNKAEVIIDEKTK